MKKTLYSLMLSDEVVRAADAAAHRLGMNRSGYVNHVLAEHLGLITPERIASDILRSLENMMSSSQALVSILAPGSNTISLKSSLEYKYRPTVKYDVQLYPSPGEYFGELIISLRTQSDELIFRINEFFEMWVQTEASYAAEFYQVKLKYAVNGKKLFRALILPGKDSSPEELARLISDYVEFADSAMKAYLSGSLGREELYTAYGRFMKTRNAFI